MHSVLTPDEIKTFQKTIWDYYFHNRRDFPWRNNYSPYTIVVSEVMLQQTQTYRVLPKYASFLQRFPNFEALANASLHDVLSVWQGLGYNRRGLALHTIAKIIMAEFGGILPQEPEILITLPGIGRATAASICAFAFNKPTIFIETNIRTVFIHVFFKNQIEIKDTMLMPLIATTVDAENPREWYYALMDYGSALKQMIPNPSRKSAHHTIQSKFKGSDREIRGMILKILTMQKHVLLQEFNSLIDREPSRIHKALTELIREGFIQETKNVFSIKN